MQFFSVKNQLTYCNNVAGLITAMGMQHVASQCRLFIDYSKRSIKAALLFNSNEIASVPLAYSTAMKESYNSIKEILDCLDYQNHNWFICGDLKVIGLCLGLQSGFTKYPCFLCYWDSRDRENHYRQIKWKSRDELVPGDKNCLEYCFS